MVLRAAELVYMEHVKVNKKSRKRGLMQLIFSCSISFCKQNLARQWLGFVKKGRKINTSGHKTGVPSMMYL